MVTQIEAPTKTQNFITYFSYNSNLMLAAIISLLLVILFVLLLHLYAKCFLAQSRARRRRRTTNSIIANSHFLGPSRFHHFNHFHTFDTVLSDSPTKGLDDSIVRAIPVFIYNPKEQEQEHEHEQEDDKLDLECVICLSVFEKNEIGKKLPKCGHAFHIECIDMWLRSHCNCPICRAPVACEPAEVSESVSNDSGFVEGDSSSTLEIEIEIPGLSNNCVAMSDPMPVSSSSSSSSLPLGCSSLPLGCSSFKRMLSRNRSIEHKVHPSSSNIELEA